MSADLFLPLAVVRADFETWLVATRPFAFCVPNYKLPLQTVTNTGDYADPAISRLWRNWQAAYAHYYGAEWSTVEDLKLKYAMQEELIAKLRSQLKAAREKVERLPFSARFKHVRLTTNNTVWRVAQELNISESEVQAIECGAYNPSLADVVRWCAILNWPLDDLLDADVAKILNRTVGVPADIDAPKEQT